MGEQIINFDTDIFLWLNSFHAPFWDYFMKTVSSRFIWIGMYLALVIALWKAYGWKAMLVVLIMTVLAVTCSDQLTASLLRPYFQRLRPANLDNPLSEFVYIVGDYRSGPYGFPSSHAANTFALATVMSLVFKRLRFTIAIFGWALLNCYSRVYLGVHYPGDLMAGMLIGASIGVVFYLIIRYITSNWLHIHTLAREDKPFDFKILGTNQKVRVVDLVIFIEIITIIWVFIRNTLLFIG